MNIRDFTFIHFPFLGMEINPPRGFSLFGIDIRFYGVIAVLGMIVSLLYGMKRKDEFGLDEDTILDGVLTILPAALLCARLYYCIFSWDLYADNPINILNIKQGGLAIYGGIIGGVIGIFIFSKIKKIPAGAILDITLLSVMIGQSIARWGNFFNREAFGEVTDSFFRMGLYNKNTMQYTYYHPTFLYESVWNFIGFIVLHFLSKKRKYDGQVALGYAAWYGFGRMFIEGLRMDSLYIGQFRVSQLIAIASFVIATTVLIIMEFKKPDPGKMLVNTLAAEQKASQVEALQMAAKLSQSKKSGRKKKKSKMTHKK